MATNYDYLNDTPNKNDRNKNPIEWAFNPVGAVLHETAGYGSLSWLLRPDVRASYTHIITRDGTLWVYVDMQRYIAWHAGIRSRWSLNGSYYEGFEINNRFFGVSVEGMNDGTPVTAAQKKTLINFMVDLAIQYDWVIDLHHFPRHLDVAPGYKDDPKGIQYQSILAEAEAVRQSRLQQQPVEYWILNAAKGNIRQAPTIASAIVRAERGGFAFGARRVNPSWLWLESGEGFISSTIANQKLVTITAQTPVVGLQTVTRDIWNQVLSETPLGSLSDRLLDICLATNVNAAVALAFLFDYPITALNINWGGVQSAINSSRVLKYTNGKPIYKTWDDALVDWCERIHVRYWELGYKTIEQVQKRYYGSLTKLEEKIKRIQSYNDLGR